MSTGVNRRGGGGSNLTFPPRHSYCHRCGGRVPLDRMQMETLDRSVHCGFYVCDDCFDGPEDLDPQPRPDEIENTPDNWWS